MRPVLTVAPELLGKYLVHSEKGRVYAAKIIEVEAYDGEQDKACHAHKGKTLRTEVMYGSAGHWYVYLVYGMHHMLNVVTGARGYPAAVLLRGVELETAQGTRLLNGPGKVTKAFGIDKKMNGNPAKKITGHASALWIEDRGVQVSPRFITCTPRIGVAYAAEWADKPYRFVLSGAEGP